MTGRRSSIPALLLVLAMPAVAVAACGGSDDSASEVQTTAPTTTAARGDEPWERVVPGGDCQCADGSEFSFWVREANPQTVVLYLQDGGACFSAETCAPHRDLYNTKVSEAPTGEGGIFDFADERNPFADHSFVHVPYCTGDVHIGNTTKEYAPGLTVEHKGYVNGTAALDHLAATFSRRDRRRRDRRERRLGGLASLRGAGVGSTRGRQDHGGGARVGLLPRRAPASPSSSPPGGSAA